MTDIVTFLTACLDEDERITRLGPRTKVTANWSIEEFQPSEPGAVPVATWVVDDQQMGVGQVNGDFVAAHIVRHDPARALRDVAAKRAIVEDCAKAIAIGHKHHGDDETKWSPVSRLAMRTLRHLATAYPGRPGYEDVMAA